MSSQILPLLDSSDVLAGALTDVAERSLFAFVDPQPADLFAERCGGESTWLCAEVGFRGEHDGVMRCALPADVAQECFAAFLGGPDEAAGDAPIFDMVGELANMICGTWLTRTYPDQVYNLSHPDVARMPAGWGPVAYLGDRAVRATLNDRPVAIWLAAAS
ncbi:MAG: chemotaxis protein CheX [Vicinamibacterales bacterium]|nr:chemotaxis protein CheX [Vicinamibacterales bacterium]